MTSASASFAQEMTHITNTKVASARKRLAELGIGAVVGGGGTYLATGSSEGALGGAGLGATAALTAGRVGAHRQFVKRLKEFMGSKKVTDSAQQLVEGSPLMTRPELIKQQLDMLDTHDVYPNYFREAAKRMKAQPEVFGKGIEALRGQEQDILKQMRATQKEWSHAQRQMRAMGRKGSPIPVDLENKSADLGNHEIDLATRLAGIRNVLQGRLNLKREVDRRAQALQKAHKASLLKSLRGAQDNITKQQEAHAKMIADSEAQIWKDVNDKLFGLF